jgi:ribonuclease HI
MSAVTIYTDGACSGNPGPGGFGIILQSGAHRREIAAGYRLTTNNRMELLALIVALESLKHPCDVTLYSDSRYVIDSIEKGWVQSWQACGWRKADKKPALNVDLWQRVLPLLKRHQVRLVWVRGHAENEGNNRCDALAVEASRGDALGVDAVFEQQHAQAAARGSSNSDSPRACSGSDPNEPPPFDL